MVAASNKVSLNFSRYTSLSSPACPVANSLGSIDGSPPSPPSFSEATGRLKSVSVSLGDRWKESRPAAGHSTAEPLSLLSQVPLREVSVGKVRLLPWTLNGDVKKEFETVRGMRCRGNHNPCSEREQTGLGFPPHAVLEF